MPRFLPSILALGIPLGCTSVLGIDGNYVIGNQEAGLVAAGGAATGGNGTESGGTETSGGSSSGGRAGMTGSGGIADTGGTKATGGAGASGGTASCDADGASCPSGQKCCPAPQASGPTASFCAEPAPIVGCDALDCMPCLAPPDNGIAVCTAGQCDFQCNATFTRKGNACQADGAGGAGGAGGASGTGGAPTCVRSQCPGCGLAGPFGCCKSNGTCGCIPYFGPCL